MTKPVELPQKGATKLLLLRTRFHNGWTGGQLYINDECFCFTLEDQVRERQGVSVEKWKVYGETAIPRGIYNVVFANSPKFGPDTITLLKVEGFEGIRIHAGNSAKDTEGCIIVGYRIGRGGIIVPETTRPALRDLKLRLKEQKDISIQIL